MDIQKTPVYAVIVSVVALVIVAIAYLYYSLYRYKLQAINAGLEDEMLKKEYSRSDGKSSLLADVLSVVFTVAMVGFFAASLYAGGKGNYFPVSGMGTFQVVASGSMSFANEKNTYLAEKGLTNQFNTYDIIGVKPVPAETALDIYDVVVYNDSGRLIVHRIIGMEEKDGKMHYTMRGDANSSDDIKPITYSDMIGIYTGFKIPMIGIFVIFLQSALGYIAMGLVFLMEIGSVYFEKKIDKAARKRLKQIGYTVTE